MGGVQKMKENAHNGFNFGAAKRGQQLLWLGSVIGAFQCSLTGGALQCTASKSMECVTRSDSM